MDNDVIMIYTAQDNLEAEMILDILKSNRIPAYKKDLGNAGIMNVYTGNSRDGEEIFVAPAHAEAATELLKDMGIIGESS